MIEVLLILLIISCIEGLREGYFYDINRAAGFVYKEKDVMRKRINSLFHLGFVILLFKLYGYYTIFLAAVGIRFFFLELVLNSYRRIPVFYSSERDLPNKIVRWIAYKTGIPSNVTAGIVRFTLLLIGVSAVIIEHYACSN